ncbi:MAG: hypothetical protein ACRCXT_21140, partial [Paraclostridium sp.]
NDSTVIKGYVEGTECILKYNTSSFNLDVVYIKEGVNISHYIDYCSAYLIRKILGTGYQLEKYISLNISKIRDIIFNKCGNFNIELDISSDMIPFSKNVAIILNLKIIPELKNDYLISEMSIVVKYKNCILSRLDYNVGISHGNGIYTADVSEYSLNRAILSTGIFKVR